MKIFRIIVVLSVIGIVGIKARIANADGLFEGWQYTEVASTETVVFNGGGRVKAIYVSSDTTFQATNYVVLCDTPGATSNAVFPAAFSSAVRRSPVLFFADASSAPTTTTAISLTSRSNLVKAIDYGEDGVIITSACFLYKSAAASGEAVKAGVLWRK